MSAPSDYIVSLVNEIARRQKAEAQVAAVLALHRKHIAHSRPDDFPTCAEDGFDWPCLTVAVLREFPGMSGDVA